MSSAASAGEHYQDMASEHGMSVEIFDMLDVTGGEDLAVADVRDELGVTTDEAKSLLARAVENGYLWEVSDEKIWMFTPKGAAPFGGLSDSAMQELRDAGWRGV